LQKRTLSDWSDTPHPRQDLTSTDFSNETSSFINEMGAGGPHISVPSGRDDVDDLDIPAFLISFM
jgi:hypothetical protein